MQLVCFAMCLQYKKERNETEMSFPVMRSQSLLYLFLFVFLSVPTSGFPYVPLFFSQLKTSKF